MITHSSQRIACFATSTTMIVNDSNIEQLQDSLTNLDCERSKKFLKIKLLKQKTEELKKKIADIKAHKEATNHNIEECLTKKKLFQQSSALLLAQTEAVKQEITMRKKVLNELNAEREKQRTKMIAKANEKVKCVEELEKRLKETWLPIKQQNPALETINEMLISIQELDQKLQTLKKIEEDCKERAHAKQKHKENWLRMKASIIEIAQTYMLVKEKNECLFRLRKEKAKEADNLRKAASLTSPQPAPPTMENNESQYFNFNSPIRPSMNSSNFGTVNQQIEQMACQMSSSQQSSSTSASTTTTTAGSRFAMPNSITKFMCSTFNRFATPMQTTTTTTTTATTTTTMAEPPNMPNMGNFPWIYGSTGRDSNDSNTTASSTAASRMPQQQQQRQQRPNQFNLIQRNEPIVSESDLNSRSINLSQTINDDENESSQNNLAIIDNLDDSLSNKNKPFQFGSFSKNPDGSSINMNKNKPYAFNFSSFSNNNADKNIKRFSFDQSVESQDSNQRNPRNPFDIFKI